MWPLTICKRIPGLRLLTPTLPLLAGGLGLRPGLGELSTGLSLRTLTVLALSLLALLSTLSLGSTVLLAPVACLLLPGGLPLLLVLPSPLWLWGIGLVTPTGLPPLDPSPLPG